MLPETVTALPDVGALAAGPADAPETLLFLHGWGGSKELWWNALADLSDTFRCIAPDLPGTGGTPLPPGLHSMRDMARWVTETCARLGLSRVTLVGHSLGGNLAAQTALDFPSLVRRLALVDAALEAAFLPGRARWPLSPRLGVNALRVMRLASLPLAAVGRGIAPECRANFWQGYARRTHWYAQANRDHRALQLQLRVLTENSLPPARFSALRVPVLILHGAKDAVVPVAQARSLARALPAAHLVVFSTAQHCPMDTDPDRFAQVIREFCAEASP